MLHSFLSISKPISFLITSSTFSSFSTHYHYTYRPFDAFRHLSSSSARFNIFISKEVMLTVRGSILKSFTILVSCPKRLIHIRTSLSLSRAICKVHLHARRHQTLLIARNCDATAKDEPDWEIIAVFASSRPLRCNTAPVAKVALKRVEWLKWSSTRCKWFCKKEVA